VPGKKGGELDHSSARQGAKTNLKRLLKIYTKRDDPVEKTEHKKTNTERVLMRGNAEKRCLNKCVDLGRGGGGGHVRLGKKEGRRWCITAKKNYPITIFARAIRATRGRARIIVEGREWQSKVPERRKGNAPPTSRSGEGHHHPPAPIEGHGTVVRKRARTVRDTKLIEKLSRK